MTAIIRQHDSIHNPFPLDDGSIQMVITSPPYFNAEDYSQWKNYNDYLRDMYAVWKECYRVLCAGGRIAINVPMGYGRPGSGGYRTIGMDTTSAMIASGFILRGIIVWYKTVADVGSLLGTAWGTYKSARNPSLRDSYEIIIVAHKADPSRGPGADTIDGDTFLASTEALWKIPPAPSSWHPAPFPPEIPRRLIELYTYLGDTVLDPFSGSGTTAKTAHKLGRNAIGYDLSAEYVRHSTEELAMMSGDWELHREMRAKRATEVTDLPMFAGVRG